MPRNTLTSINILAELLHSQGKHKEAEPLCREVLAGFTACVGPEHPFTVSAVENLSAVLVTSHHCLGGSSAASTSRGSSALEWIFRPSSPLLAPPRPSSPLAPPHHRYLFWFAAVVEASERPCGCCAHPLLLPAAMLACSQLASLLLVQLPLLPTAVRVAFGRWLFRAELLRWLGAIACGAHESRLLISRHLLMTELPSPRCPPSMAAILYGAPALLSAMTVLDEARSPILGHATLFPRPY